VSLIMFGTLGDKWTVRDCAIVMSVGQIITLPAIFLLCFFSDDLAVPDGGVGDNSSNRVDDDGRRSDRNDPTTLDAEEGVGYDEESETEVEIERICLQSDSSCFQEHLPGTSDVSEETPPSDTTSSDMRRRLCSCIPNHRLIPVLVASSDVTAGLAAGMSIRYFPIFFVDYLHLDPVTVQSLYMLAPVVMAILMHVAQLLSKRYGRFHVAVAFRWTGICFMLLMISSYHFKFPVWVVCAMYVLRTAFMNSPGALTRSALMDSVPKEERAKWASLESVNMFSWSGSAFVGGILVGFIGMLPLFGVTAFVQFLSSLFLVALLEKDKSAVGTGESSENISDGEEEPALDEPSRQRTSSSTSSGSWSSGESA